jgi:hypothetical protein
MSSPMPLHSFDISSTFTYGMNIEATTKLSF